MTVRCRPAPRSLLNRAVPTRTMMPHGEASAFAAESLVQFQIIPKGIVHRALEQQSSGQACAKEASCTCNAAAAGSIPVLSTFVFAGIAGVVQHSLCTLRPPRAGCRRALPGSIPMPAPRRYRQTVRRRLGKAEIRVRSSVAARRRSGVVQLVGRWPLDPAIAVRPRAPELLRR
jgi:hypothetical protein